MHPQSHIEPHTSSTRTLLASELLKLGALIGQYLERESFEGTRKFEAQTTRRLSQRWGLQ